MTGINCESVTGGVLPVINVWLNQLHVCKFDASKTTHPQFKKERAIGCEESGSIGLQVHGGKIAGRETSAVERFTDQSFRMKDIRSPDHVDNWTCENHLTKDRPW